MEREGYVRVAASGDLRDRPFLVVEVAQRDVVLVRTGDGTVRAFPNTCPHLGQPLRSGEVSGTVLECPIHFYAFDLTTGRNTFPGGSEDVTLQIYDVREAGGEIFVRIPAGTPPQPTTARPPD